MRISINSDAWLQAGLVVARTGEEFAAGIRENLAALANTGTDGRSGSVDALVAGILPAVMEAVEPTVDGIAAGLRKEGEGLTETGHEYAEVEDEANELGELQDGEF